MTQTPEQKQAADAYRQSHPIPANETAEAKIAREAQEKAEKDSANASSNPDRY